MPNCETVTYREEEEGQGVLSGGTVGKWQCCDRGPQLGTTPPRTPVSALPLVAGGILVKFLKHSLLSFFTYKPLAPTHRAVGIYTKQVLRTVPGTEEVSTR